jgi:hypothetical protein
MFSPTNKTAGADYLSQRTAYSLTCPAVFVLIIHHRQRKQFASQTAFISSSRHSISS